ncbi:hypothetical protein D1007_04489 [Hordeum vulgare]|nr:hypothetical protein D1007_04489 [Hordeum vulgare]
MTVTLQDIAMITGLLIEGRGLIGKVRSDGWRQRLAGLVGVEPKPWTHETRKDPRPSAVLFSWIQRHFRKCPKDGSTYIVERYARAYLCNLLTQVVFRDGTGDTTSWMFLDPLHDWDVKWSWGSAALAFLYHQLDGACMRNKPTSTLGGFVSALQDKPKNNKSVINWEEHHIMWVDMWNAQRNARVETDQTPDTDEAAYLRHLEWMHKE